MTTRWITSAFLLFPLALVGQPSTAGSRTVVEAAPAGEVDADAIAQAFHEQMQLPRRAIVSGVPFISWSAMSRTRYEGWEFRNPSFEASARMLLAYLNEGLVSDADFANAAAAVGDDMRHVQDARPEDLKSYLARGIPAMVMLSLTPRAHPLYAAYEAMITIGRVRVKQPRSAASGALGTMLPLNEVESFTKLHMNPVTETVTGAVRVVVGYDDDLRVWYLHDPSFGPAMPLPYDELDRMQQPVGKIFAALEPPNIQEIVALRRTAGPYRERTGDERAAWEFVNGYANSGTGELKEGERRFRAGLSIPQVGPAYRFLLTYELALTLHVRGEEQEALVLAQEASRLLPSHPGPWRLIAEIGAASRSPELRALGADAAGRWPALQADEAAAERVARTIPSDFLVTYLVSRRGWGGDPTLAPQAGVTARLQQSLR